METVYDVQPSVLRIKVGVKGKETKEIMSPIRFNTTLLLELKITKKNFLEIKGGYVQVIFRSVERSCRQRV